MRKKANIEKKRKKSHSILIEDLKDLCIKVYQSGILSKGEDYFSNQGILSYSKERRDHIFDLMQ